MQNEIIQKAKVKAEDGGKTLKKSYGCTSARRATRKWLKPKPGGNRSAKQSDALGVHGDKPHYKTSSRGSGVAVYLFAGR